MLPIVGRVGLARLGGVSLFALLAGPAFAGDRALADFLGFSEDGRYFAFEEFGIQDGSGFAYSNVYVIDLEADAWVQGTPVRVRADEETMDAPLDEIRDEALGEAEPILDEFGIDVPVDILALVGDGVGGEAKTLAFSMPGYAGPGAVEGLFDLHLETFVAEPGQPCADYTELPVLGLSLSLLGDGADRVLAEDETIPTSRGCPLDYRIYAVVAPLHGGGLADAVAIVSSYPLGFEGPDRRFLAFPIGE